jgi:hypothetical protein
VQSFQKTLLTLRGQDRLLQPQCRCQPEKPPPFTSPCSGSHYARDSAASATPPKDITPTTALVPLLGFVEVLGAGLPEVLADPEGAGAPATARGSRPAPDGAPSGNAASAGPARGSMLSSSDMPGSGDSSSKIGAGAGDAKGSCWQIFNCRMCRKLCNY